MLNISFKFLKPKVELAPQNNNPYVKSFIQLHLKEMVSVVDIFKQKPRKSLVTWILFFIGYYLFMPNKYILNPAIYSSGNAQLLETYTWKLLLIIATEFPSVLTHRTCDFRYILRREFDRKSRKIRTITPGNRCLAIS